MYICTNLTNMDNCTLSSTFNDTDAYEIDMDSACIGMDYDVADDIQYQLEQIAHDDCDIEFE